MAEAAKKGTRERRQVVRMTYAVPSEDEDESMSDWSSGSDKRKRKPAKAAPAAAGRGRAKKGKAGKKGKKRKPLEPLPTEPSAMVDLEDLLATGVDVDDLTALRSMWEVPAACHVLAVLRTKHPRITRFSMADVEMGLLHPAQTDLMDELCTRLLALDPHIKREVQNMSIHPYVWWTERLRSLVGRWYEHWDMLRARVAEAQAEVERYRAAAGGETAAAADDDEFFDEAELFLPLALTPEENGLLREYEYRLGPLGEHSPLAEEETRFGDLGVRERVRLFHALCCWAIETPPLMAHVVGAKDKNMGLIRVDRLGRDREGHSYYHFPAYAGDGRLYRLERDAGDADFQLWAHGQDAFVELKRVLDTSDDDGDAELAEQLGPLIEVLEVHRQEQLKSEEREQKRAKLAAMPRKRSTRVQEKEVSAMEAAQRAEEEAVRRAEEEKVRERERRKREEERALLQNDPEHQEALRQGRAERAERREQALSLQQVQEQAAAEQAAALAAIAAQPPQLYCVCRQPDDGTPMVGCEMCDEWFHYRCVGIDPAVISLEAEYLCPSCRPPAPVAAAAPAPALLAPPSFRNQIAPEHLAAFDQLYAEKMAASLQGAVPAPFQGAVPAPFQGAPVVAPFQGAPVVAPAPAPAPFQGAVPAPAPAPFQGVVPAPVAVPPPAPFQGAVAAPAPTPVAAPAPAPAPFPMAAPVLMATPVARTPVA